LRAPERNFPRELKGEPGEHIRFAASPRRRASSGTDSIDKDTTRRRSSWIEPATGDVLKIVVRRADRPAFARECSNGNRRLK
jgi:hypothetical protein